MAKAPVGYKNPPEHGQFQKGRSGNPKGRPPKSERPPTPAEIYNKVLMRTIPISRNGIVEEITTLEAMWTTAVQQFLASEKPNVPLLQLMTNLASIEENAPSLEEEDTGNSNEALSAYLKDLFAQLEPGRQAVSNEQEDVVEA
jgi:hypothetical protein